jgi:hypothetical protein
VALPVFVKGVALIAGQFLRGAVIVRILALANAPDAALHGAQPQIARAVFEDRPQARAESPILERDRVELAVLEPAGAALGRDPKATIPRFANRPNEVVAQAVPGVVCDHAFGLQTI